MADHAYWLSGMRLRDGSGAAPLGSIDVRSHGFGVGDPVAGATQHGGGTLSPGTLGALAYTEQSKAWPAGPPAEAVADRLDIDVKNLTAVTIDPARARVDCDAQLAVKSDGPVTITLAGCRRTASFGGGASGSCDASRPPRASVSHVLLASRRRGLRFSGRAIAFRCAGGRAVRGKVRRVTVSISRASGKRCRFVGAGGRLGKPRSCARPVQLSTRMGRVRRGKYPWSYSSSVGLPRGTYTILVRSVDSRGKVGGRRGRFNRRTFAVR